MKTAISLPDALYKDAEITAKNLGIPRSQLFAKALEEFLRHHQRQGITEKLNTVYSQFTENTVSDISLLGLESIRELTKNDSW